MRPVLLPAGAAPRPNDALIPHQVPNLSEIRYMTIRYMTIRYMTIRYMTIRYVKKTDAGGVTTAGRSRTRDARAGSRVQAGRARHQLLLKVLLHDRRVPPRRRPTPYARHAQCPLGGHAGGGRRKAAVVKQLAAAHSLVRYGMRRGNDRGGGGSTRWYDMGCVGGTIGGGVEEREVGMHRQCRFPPRDRPPPASSAPPGAEVASHAPTRARLWSRLAARVDHVQGRARPSPY